MKSKKFYVILFCENSIHRNFAAWVVFVKAIFSCLNLKTDDGFLPYNMPELFNPFNANFKKWSNTLKQFVGKLATNCLSVFDHFVGLALKGLIKSDIISQTL